MINLENLITRIDLSGLPFKARIVTGESWFQVAIYVTERFSSDRMWFPSEVQNVGADWDELKILRAISAELCSFIAHEVLEGFKFDGKVLFDPHAKE